MQHKKLPYVGHRNEKETGNLWNLVHLVSRFNSNSDSFFSSKEEKYKFMFPEIQNEIVGLMTTGLQQYFLTKICEESTAGKAKKEGRFFIRALWMKLKIYGVVSKSVYVFRLELHPAEILFGF